MPDWLVIGSLGSMFFFFVVAIIFDTTPSRTSTAKSSGAYAEEVTKKQKIVYVKYRDTGLVDVNNDSFRYKDMSRSSFVRSAWYDDTENYMIVKLKDTYYHYCDLPISVWDSFIKASSFGSFYEDKIQGDYSCRYQEVPSY